MTAASATQPRLVDLVTSTRRRSDYVARGLWNEITLPEKVAEHAAARPDAVAVIDAAGEHTFADLATDSARLAAAMAGRGVVSGAVVSIQLPNRYEAVVAAVAALSLGAVVNPLLPNYRLHELAHVFATVRPAMLFTPGTYRGFDHRALVAELLSTDADAGRACVHVVVGADEVDDVERDVVRDGLSTISYGVLHDEGPESVQLGRGSAAAVSEVIFTSGTEARPKAIMHTEQTANFSVRVAYADLGIGPADVVWMPSPIGHSTGFNYGVRFALYHGLPLVLQDQWNGDVAAALVAQHGCSYTLAATTFLQDLIAAATRAGTSLQSLRCFGCGGAPVPARLVDAAADHGVRVLRLYGSTEVLVGSWNRPNSSLDHRRHSDGVAMTDVEMTVRDDDGNDVALGAEGELWTRGPNTCVGFFADPERTAATFDGEGWVRSGDLVVMDADGYVTVVGRKKEIIIRGGINIAPREIEDIIVGFAEVQRAAVVGLPDERLGETMCACVVLEPDTDLDLETTTSRLRAAGLATYKLPQRLEVLATLPTTASGKIQKHEIVRTLTAPGADQAG